jgi:hypothetical protein
MDRNLVGTILGRPFIKIAHLVPIHLQTWPLQATLIFDWLISKKKFSESALPNEPKHGSEYPCKVFYKDCSSVPICSYGRQKQFLFPIG